MTKVVGTIGPVSEDFQTMQHVVQEGLRVMRINFSHATYDEAKMRMKNLKACKGVHSIHGQEFNVRSVLLDTQGPEIRSGTLKEKLNLIKGEFITLTTNVSFKDASDRENLFVDYPKLSTTVQVGDPILLDDGLIRLSVKDVLSPETIRCEIQNTEHLGSRKGVNLPGCTVDLPALTTKDRKDIEFGIQHDVDFIAASFVRTAQDVRDIRSFISAIHPNYWPPDHPKPRIISKIENHQGVMNFQDILNDSDGIMVARGDLGVEIPLHQVLSAQKNMVAACNRVGKPVIVATQMLESMMHHPRPTRAEVSDVGNAVLDGADAVMLSGEVAQGSYPIESVQTMMRIVKEADRMLANCPNESLNVHTTTKTPASNDVESIASSAVKVAHELQADLILVLTDTGLTAQMVAKYRPHVPVMCFAASKKVARQLQLHRALYPIVSANATRPNVKTAIESAKGLGWLKSGDKVIVLSADEVVVKSGAPQILLRVSHVE